VQAKQPAQLSGIRSGDSTVVSIFSFPELRCEFRYGKGLIVYHHRKKVSIPCQKVLDKLFNNDYINI
jgi:hypothetical protein